MPCSLSKAAWQSDTYLHERTESHTLWKDLNILWHHSYIKRGAFFGLLSVSVIFCCAFYDTLKIWTSPCCIFFFLFPPAITGKEKLVKTINTFRKHPCPYIYIPNSPSHKHCCSGEHLNIHQREAASRQYWIQIQTLDPDLSKQTALTKLFEPSVRE